MVFNVFSISGSSEINKWYLSKVYLKLPNNSFGRDYGMTIEFSFPYAIHLENLLW